MGDSRVSEEIEDGVKTPKADIDLVRVRLGQLRKDLLQ